MSVDRTKIMLNIVSALSLVLCAILVFVGIKTGVLTSQVAMQNFISSLGICGILVFVLFQIVQVVVPIMPGGISCLVGVVMCGAVGGFIYNYIGICIGSILAFIIARAFGKHIIHKLFSEKLIHKYESWTAADGKFGKMLAVAIFLPVAPDDFLCYLAGTTNMTLKRFSLIIILGKPFAIALYSLGLATIFNNIMKMTGVM